MGFGVFFKQEQAEIRDPLYMALSFNVVLGKNGVTQLIWLYFACI